MRFYLPKDAGLTPKLHKDPATGETFIKTPPHFHVRDKEGHVMNEWTPAKPGSAILSFVGGNLHVIEPGGCVDLADEFARCAQDHCPALVTEAEYQAKKGAK